MRLAKWFVVFWVREGELPREFQNYGESPMLADFAWLRWFADRCGGHFCGWGK